MFHTLLNPFSYMLKAFLQVDRCIPTVTSETGPPTWCVMGERKGKHCSPCLQLVKWTDNGNRLRENIKLMGQTALSASWELVHWWKSVPWASHDDLWSIHLPWGKSACQELCMCIDGDEFVGELRQTYLTSCLQLFISCQGPSLVLADSLGLFICQLVSPFAGFPVVNSSCLFCQRETAKKASEAWLSVLVTVVTLSLAPTVICIQFTHNWRNLLNSARYKNHPRALDHIHATDICCCISGFKSYKSWKSDKVLSFYHFPLDWQLRRGWRVKFWMDMLYFKVTTYLISH